MQAHQVIGSSCTAIPMEATYAKPRSLSTGADGAPPYTVRWIEDDRESVVFPAQTRKCFRQTSKPRSTGRNQTNRPGAVRAGRTADRGLTPAESRSRRLRAPSYSGGVEHAGWVR